MRAFYEAASPSRTRKARSDRTSANAENQRSAESLRIQARHLEENLDIATGALDVLVNNVVGAGIQPEPQVKLRNGEPAEDINRELLRLFDDWMYNPEVTWQWDYYSLQRLAARSWFRDGEVFGQRLIGPVALLDHGTVVPYSLELLESDYVPYSIVDAPRGVIQGIELNAWGRPRFYYVYKVHPGDNAAFASGETKRVQAERMIHLKMARRLGQLRGVSVFASVIARLDDIKEIDESERVAARVAAAMAAFIKKGTPDLYSPPAAADELDAQGRPLPRAMDIAPGMVFDDLRPGEDIGTFDPKRPNNALIPFRDSQLRSAAGGLGTSYSSLSKNYNGTYSAQRQELVESFVNYRALSRQFSFRFCQPVWDGFVDAALAARLIVPGADVDMQSIYDASHSAPPMPWIDPLREAEANALDEDRGYTSRSRIIRERGKNPDEINREIRRDQAEKERLGLNLAGSNSSPVMTDDSSDDDSSDAAD